MSPRVKKRDYDRQEILAGQDHTRPGADFEEVYVSLTPTFLRACAGGFPGRGAAISRAAVTRGRASLAGKGRVRSGAMALAAQGFRASVRAFGRSMSAVPALAIGAHSTAAGFC